MPPGHHGRACAGAWGAVSGPVTRTPYRTLAALYGEEALLALRPRVAEALANAVLARIGAHLEGGA
jgi:hypothetical protein